MQTIASLVERLDMDATEALDKLRYLFFEVKIMGASGAVPGANVALSFECSSGELIDFSGTTDGDGIVRFRLHKPPVGDYVITVTSLTCSGFVWDTSQGITAAAYALSR